VVVCLPLINQGLSESAAVTMPVESSNVDSLKAERARSLKQVETVFACIVLLCVGCALFIHVSAESFGVPPAIRQSVVLAFMTMAFVDLIALFGCKAWLSRP
jgi:hypothetical protein